MRDILQMNIQELINDFLETHRSKSAANLKGILSKAFNDAVENKIVKNNPCVNILSSWETVCCMSKDFILFPSRFIM